MPLEETDMGSGGSRVRSGPAKDPNSARSDRARRVAKKAAAGSTTTPAKKTAAKKSTTTKSAAGSTTVEVTSLPMAGYTGRAPAFPLPKIGRGLDADGNPNRAAADSFRKREMEIWRQVWKTPQAAAWSIDPWRWPTVAEFCRIKAAVELDPDSNAALLSRLREYRNEIGLSPDGMKANGWAISRDQVTPRAEKKAAAKTTTAKPQRRLRSVSGSTAG
jgi:hypothetical protein